MQHLRTQAKVLPVALAMLAGRGCACVAGVPAQAVLLSAFLLFHLLGPRRRAIWAALLAAACGALLWVPVPTVDRALPRQPGLVDFKARVTRTPRRDRFGGAVARVTWRRHDVSLLVRGRRSPMAAGATVAGKAWFEPATPASAARLRTRAELLRVRPAPLLQRIRAGLVGAIERRFRTGLDAREAPFLLRILLGRGHDAQPADIRNHRRTGLAHLLAISGLHALLVAQICGFALACVLRRRAARIALAATLVTYAWLSGFRPPVVRAVCGYLVWRWCSDRGHGFSLAAALAAAAGISVVLFPEDVGSLSFCFSYLAVIGLTTLAPPVVAALSPTTRFGTWFWNGLAASIAAQIATAALSLYVFGYVSPVGALFTMAALPWIATMFCLAFVAPPLAWIAPPAGEIVFSLLGSCTSLYLDTIALLAHLPGCPIHTRGTPPPLLVPALLASTVIAASLLASRRTFLLGCSLAIVPFFVAWKPDARTRFCLLAVGHGQAAVCTTPGWSLAIDCGDATGGRRAAAKIAERLRRSGHSQLDALVLTHGDLDHASGVAELALRIPIGHVWLPENSKSAPTERLLQQLGIPYTVLRPGTSIRPLDACRLHAPHEHGDQLSSNEGALLMELDFGLASIVVTGDQEAAGIAAATRLLAARSRRCDVLVLPHHAAFVPRLVPLLTELAPRLCVASTPTHRRLSPVFLRGALRRYRPLTTARCGDIEIEVSNRSLRVSPAILPAPEPRSAAGK